MNQDTMARKTPTYTVEVQSNLHLVVYYCNDCGNPYLTDNDGTRACICDYCRAENGDHMLGCAIEGDA